MKKTIPTNPQLFHIPQEQRHSVIYTCKQLTWESNLPPPPKRFLPRPAPPFLLKFLRSFCSWMYFFQYSTSSSPEHETGGHQRGDVSGTSWVEHSSPYVWNNWTTFFYNIQKKLYLLFYYLKKNCTIIIYF